MLWIFLVLSVLVVVQAGHSPNGLNAVNDAGQISRSVSEDAILDVPGLLTKYGYPVESHTAQTQDGYLLKMHRIPHGKQGPSADRPVVFLMHGHLCSSADWVLMGPENGLGYILADEGYDVWMGNARGNFYSRNHTFLDPETSKFWKFSWNEIGYYDLPAMIDYMLKVSGQPKLHYIGHSQGTTVFFVMGANRKEYNSKIISMQALSPVGYMSHLKSPLVIAMAPWANSIDMFLNLIGQNEFMPSKEMNAIAAEMYCKEGSIYLPVCANMLFLLAGYNPELLNTTMLPVIMGHTPAGASSRQFVHYGQEYMSARFRQFDFGALNWATYGSLVPPKYELKYVTAPVALHYADNDWLADPVDVEKLFKEIPNPIGKFRVLHNKFNHLDFLWAINVKQLLYNRVITLLKTFN